LSGSDATVWIPADQLAAWAEAVLRSTGVPAEPARVVADCLVRADLMGVSSHGVSRMAIYLKRVDLGLVAVAAAPRVLRESTSALVVDAADGFGHPAAVWAAERCAEKARASGAAVAGIVNSTHFGMAGQYAELMARAGMVGIATTNSSPRMAPWGAVDALLGTNPLAIAVPAEDGEAIVLDMATSVAALGKIVEAAADGRALPPGWALDGDGQPTTDPQAALAGTVLPLAGPKGSGLAMMIDVLAGVLTGARFGTEVGSLYRDLAAPERCGHFLAAISIESFLPLDLFRRRIGQYVGMLKACRPRAGIDEVLLPGEVERRRERAARRDGVALSAATWAGLLEIADARGVPLQRAPT
jgi:LDH2 family malate/lactate/ureidoglycolate dehydrogenase